MSYNALMADPIKINFKVNSKKAIGDINSVANALKTVSGSVATLPEKTDINISTTAPEVNKEVEKLATTLDNVAGDALPSIVIDVDLSETVAEIEKLETKLEAVRKKSKEVEKTVPKATSVFTPRKFTLDADLNRTAEGFNGVAEAVKEIPDLPDYMRDAGQIATFAREGEVFREVLSEAAGAAIIAAKQTNTAGRSIGFLSAMMLKGRAAVRAFGVAMKSGLGLVGVALIGIEIVILGVQKGWEKLTSVLGRSKNVYQAQTQTIAEQAQEAEELAKELGKVATESERAAAREQAELKILAETQRVTKEYEKQTAEIDKQLRLKEYGLDAEAQNIQYTFERKKNELEIRATNNNYTERERSVALRQLEEERDQGLAGVSNRRAQEQLDAARKRVDADQAALDKARGVQGYTQLGDLDITTLQRLSATIGSLSDIAARDQARTNADDLTIQRVSGLRAAFEGKGSDDLGGDEYKQLVSIAKRYGRGEEAQGLSVDELQDFLESLSYDAKNAIRQRGDKELEIQRLGAQAGIDEDDYRDGNNNIDYKAFGAAVAAELKLALDASQEVERREQTTATSREKLQEARRNRDTVSISNSLAQKLRAQAAEAEDVVYYDSQRKAAARLDQADALRGAEIRYSGASDDELETRILELEKKASKLEYEGNTFESEYVRQDQDLAQAELQSRLKKRADDIMKDGVVSRKEQSQLAEIQKQLATLDPSTEVAELVRSFRSMAQTSLENTRRTSQQYSELLVTVKQLDQQLQLLSRGQSKLSGGL